MIEYILITWLIAEAAHYIVIGAWALDKHFYDKWEVAHHWIPLTLKIVFWIILAIVITIVLIIYKYIINKPIDFL